MKLADEQATWASPVWLLVSHPKLPCVCPVSGDSSLIRRAGGGLGNLAYCAIAHLYFAD